MIDDKWMKSSDGHIACIGTQMERTVELLKALNEQVEESKAVLQSLHNEINAISQIVQPQLLTLVNQLRESRMTVVREVREIMSELKDVRKFFIESEHTAEMERLERFVKVCLELKQLKAEGTLDALADTIIKLSLTEDLCSK